MKTQKKLVYIGVAICFLAVISAVLLTYLTKKNMPIVNEPEPVQFTGDIADTNNWLTYENKELNFSIKYPPTWHKTEDVFSVLPCQNDSAKNCGKIFRFFIEIPSVDGSPIQIEVMPDRNGLPLKDYLKEKGWPEVENKCKTVQVNNLESLDCGLFTLFSYQTSVYWVSWSDFYGNIPDYVDDLLQILPGVPAPSGSENMAESQAFNEQVVRKFASTFMLLNLNLKK